MYFAAETVHGHAPIHNWSVNSGLTVAPLGEIVLLVTDGPLGVPRIGELKGGKVKKPRGSKSRGEPA